MTGPTRPDGYQRRKHLVLADVTTAERFRSPQSGRHRPVPARNRQAHAARLRSQLEQVREQSAAEQAETGEVAGILLEFEGFSDVSLAVESLARERSGIELLNVRSDGRVTFATVYVPEGKLAHFERLVTDYVTEKKTRTGRAADHQRLVDAIATIRKGTLRALWTDAPELFPQEDGEPVSWETWLSVRNRRSQILEEFQAHAHAAGMSVADGAIEFPERTVVLVRGSPAQMKSSVVLLNLLAELRLAKETADFFDSMAPTDQADWVDDFLARASFAGDSENTPYVCVLDTGVNAAHPLLAPAIAQNDLHSVDPSWGPGDVDGHGTEMAGLALHGDLTHAIAGTGLRPLRHRLESVKLLPRDGANQGDGQLHGYLTTEAVARPEVTAPNRSRVFGMAVCTRDSRDRGRPSAWSAAIDRLASDVDGEGRNPRLFVVAAGNADPAAYVHYPDSNSSDGIHDPGQAWNALTVGSSTELVRITEPNTVAYRPVAASGGLSPFSTTSATWDPQWPLKPDVVLEGGNAGRDGTGAYSMASLSLLTSHAQFTQRLLTTMRETSASTALCARLAAELRSEYPTLRPESIRALIVHSATWTPELRRMYLPSEGNTPTKADILRLLRHAGFGVPSLEVASWSASNSVSLIIEEIIQPFRREGSKPPTLNEMHLHTLPWPLDELEALSDTTVEMRVTLSYFVEPNPSARARSRYSYQSHGLRFKVKRADETVDAFRSRVNHAAREDEAEFVSSAEDSGWVVGEKARHRGSIHSDLWIGSAVDLASRGVIAVYPTTGWWKTRQALSSYNRQSPYTLVVSIRTPPIAVDLYAAIESRIAITTATEV